MSVVVMEMKFRSASAIESAFGATTAPKLQGLLNQPLVEAEVAPVVVRVGVFPRVIAPAMRAGKVVRSVHAPAGNVLFSVAVETAFWSVPDGYTKGPGEEPEMFTTSVLYVKLTSATLRPTGSNWSTPVATSK